MGQYTTKLLELLVTSLIRGYDKFQIFTVSFFAYTNKASPAS